MRGQHTMWLVADGKKEEAGVARIERSEIRGIDR